MSGFYAWRRNTRSDDLGREALAVEVRRVFDASNSTYGYRRVHSQLAKDGVGCCEKVVRKVMAELGLVSCHPAPWRYKTQSDGSDAPADLIRQQFSATRPGVRFVGDITQIDTWEGPAYLSTMIDLFNSEVAGWAFDDNYHTDLICSTVAMARRECKRVTRRRVSTCAESRRRADLSTFASLRTWPRCMRCAHNFMRRTGHSLRALLFRPTTCHAFCPRATVLPFASGLRDHSPAAASDTVFRGVGP